MGGTFAAWGISLVFFVFTISAILNYQMDYRERNTYMMAIDVVIGLGCLMFAVLFFPPFHDYIRPYLNDFFNYFQYVGK